METQTTKQATKSFRRIPAGDVQAIIAAIQTYATTGAGNVISLAGTNGLYRLRVGQYRVIFEIEADTMRILFAGQRAQVYRFLQ